MKRVILYNFLGTAVLCLLFWGTAGCNREDQVEPPSDRPPTVSISSPQPLENETLCGLVTISAEAQAMDGKAIDRLEFSVDDLLLTDGVDTTAPYAGTWDTATVLVQNGSLRVGDTVIAGSVIGKVRALIDDRGHGVKLAGPSTPVEVLGLAGLPAPGDTFQVIADQAKARQVASFRQTQARDIALGAKGPRLTLEGLKDKIAEGTVKELPILVKADVQGSAEVLAATLAKLSDEKVKIRIIHSGVGAINLSDVLLASASDAIIIGFNVRPDRSASELAERDGVEIRQHSVIYHVTDEMKKAMAGLLEPTFREARVGTAEVRETFKVPKFGTIAGCMVSEGRMARTGDIHARLIRDHIVVHEGKVGSLRRFKDDVSEVKAGTECGISLERFNDIKVGDVIELYTIEKIAAAATA